MINIGDLERFLLLLEDDQIWGKFNRFLTQGGFAPIVARGDVDGSYRISARWMSHDEWKELTILLVHEGYKDFLTDPVNKQRLINDALSRVLMDHYMDGKKYLINPCTSAFGDSLLKLLPDNLKQWAEQYGKQYFFTDDPLLNNAKREAQRDGFITSFLPLYAFSLYDGEK